MLCTAPKSGREDRADFSLHLTAGNARQILDEARDTDKSGMGRQSRILSSLSCMSPTSGHVDPIDDARNPEYFLNMRGRKNFWTYGAFIQLTLFLGAWPRLRNQISGNSGSCHRPRVFSGLTIPNLLQVFLPKETIGFSFFSPDLSCKQRVDGVEPVVQVPLVLRLDQEALVLCHNTAKEPGRCPEDRLGC